MTIIYGLVFFAIIVAIAINPFGDLQNRVPPSWLMPFFGHFDLLNAFLVILFGPGIGISLMASLLVLLTIRPVHRWLRSGVNNLIYEPSDDAVLLVGKIQPHFDVEAGPQAILSAIAAANHCGFD